MMLGERDLLLPFRLILKIVAIIMWRESNGTGTINHCHQAKSFYHFMDQKFYRFITLLADDFTA